MELQHEVREELARLIRANSDPEQTNSAAPISIGGHHNVTYICPSGVVHCAPIASKKNEPTL